MIHVNEIILVEGKYDKIRLSSVIEGTILETNGFRIFKDREMQQYLRRMAEECGIVILTDSDRAGFLIRNHLKSFLPGEKIKQAFIPERKGVEKRKRTPSKEGLLGVEGIDEITLLHCLEQAGCFLNATPSYKMQLTKGDLYADGLSGGGQSAQYRREFCRKLGLPGRLSGNDFLQAVNRLLSPEEYKKTILEILGEKSRYSLKSDD